MNDEFSKTLMQLQRGDGDAAFWSRAFLVLPVTGATVATVGSVMGSETLSATGEVARRLDERQFDLGEGPCWDAVNQAAPIAEVDFAANGPARWPLLWAALRAETIGSIYAFPMTVGTVQIGAVDLYSHDPSSLSEMHQRQAQAMAEVIGQHVVRGALATEADEKAPVDTPFSRRIVHQATGLVLAQVDVDAEDAMLLIQTRAHASGTSMMDVAEQLIAGRLRYVRVDGRIEVES